MTTVRSRFSMIFAGGMLLAVCLTNLSPAANVVPLSGPVTLLYGIAARNSRVGATSACAGNANKVTIITNMYSHSFAFNITPFVCRFAYSNFTKAQILG